jgi:hypothetical protein|eukprot:COSAG06_NODE_60_length_27159_cov_57.986031_21_plen_128_part_00
MLGLLLQLLLQLLVGFAVPRPCAAPATRGGGTKHTLLPDVAPTLLNTKVRGATNPAARPLAELNDRHSSQKQQVYAADLKDLALPKTCRRQDTQSLVGTSRSGGSWEPLLGGHPRHVASSRTLVRRG